MTESNTEESIYNLHRKIRDIQADLNQLGNTSEIPELITSANLLRSNEHLSKRDEIQTELVSAYEQYSVTLERLLTVVFDIQNDLKEVIRQQSSMISQGEERKPASKR